MNSLSRSEGGTEISFHEPENVGIEFQRLTRSHPSPLIPLPFEGRGSRDRQSHYFFAVRHSHDGVQRTGHPATDLGSWPVSRSERNTELSMNPEK